MPMLSLKKIKKLFLPQLSTLFLLFVSIPIFFQPSPINARDRNRITTPLQRCRCDFCKEIKKHTALQTRKAVSIRQQPCKDWTFVVYIAADNDLRRFAAQNIKQMANIGSNKHINILVHLDIRIYGNKKVTRRYFIEKNRVLHLNPHDSETQRMDSGNPSTLISCCKWSITDFPAKEYALIFWNHGTGIIDIAHGRIINPAELFTFNPSTYRLELDRSIGYLDRCTRRGICWDDTTGNYITNQKLDSALNTICSTYLNGKKFSIIGFDACFMSMIEVGNIVKKYGHIMIGSQEVELGMGWNYSALLYPFKTCNLSKSSFAQHIVTTYAKTYNSITNDHTLSAINLDAIESIEENINQVSQTLIEALRKQKGKTVKNAIKASRNKLLCTHFDEPSYIDLHHFYHNLLANLKHFRFSDTQQGVKIVNMLSQSLSTGTNLIEKIVIANTTGRNLKKAHGLSIYFPERGIHSSYRETTFVASNSWGIFLNQYLTY